MTESNESVLQYEILQEKAQALGKAARQIEQALQALQRHDNQLAPTLATQREDLVADAAEKAHHFLILRKLCGFRDWPEVAEFYAIPPEILKRMGTSRKAT
jgi:hypothetical protein